MNVKVLFAAKSEIFDIEKRLTGPYVSLAITE